MARKVPRTKVKAKFRTVMDEFGKGTLRSSSGDKVTDVAQARAIAFSEQRRATQGRRKDIKRKDSFTRKVDRDMKHAGVIDFSKKTIKVNPRKINKGGIADTVMHEELHRKHPKKTERKIKRLTKKKLRKVPLKKLGGMIERFGKKKKRVPHYNTD